MTRQRFHWHDGGITSILLAGTILSVVWAIQAANWADGLGMLTPIALGALALGVALAAWRRVPAFVAHLITLAVGFVLIVNRLDPLLPLAKTGHGWLPALRFLWERGGIWLGAAGTDQYADDYYLFLLGLAAIVWLLGYTSAFMVFRLRWSWPALLAPAVALLFNLGYAAANLAAYLVLFLVWGFLLVARSQLAAREATWRREGVAYPESLGWRVLWTGLVVTALTVGFAWVSPFTVRGATLQTAWSRVSAPWQRVEGRFNQMFGSLRGPGTRGIATFASFGDRFQLGGPLKLSQTPVLVLQADRPYYLKARTFDNFDGRQWDSNVTATFNTSTGGRAYVPQVDLKGGQELGVQPLAASDQHTLTVRMLTPRGNALFTADQFVKTSQDSYVQLSWTQYRNHIIDLTTANRNDLPPDLLRIYDLLKSAPSLPDTDDQGNPLPPPTPTPLASPRAAGTAVARTPTPAPTATPSPQERAVAEELAQLRARLIDVRPVIRDGQAVRLLVNGQIPNYGDVEVVLPREGLQQGTQYTTTILASNATAPQLRDAGTNYPDWVVQRYLQLPPSLTERTRGLAASLANGQNPYDAAIAIQNYLRDNMKYNENIPYPPANRDTVDYFLFDAKQGYCVYYSTAMVMMLRSVGIPAREAVGYFSGEYNGDQGGYLYRESNAHAWPEVYFPGYGWIPFEPTAARAPFNREVANGQANDPNAANANGAASASPVAGTGGDGLLPQDELYGLGSGQVRLPQENPYLRVARIGLPFALLIVAIATFFWLRGLRGLTPTGQFYTRLTRSSHLAGIRLPPGATPYEQARALGRAIPGTRRSLDQIVNLYVRERYGGQRPTIQEVRLVRRAWLRFRAALLRSLVTFRRQRADGEGD